MTIDEDHAGSDVGQNGLERPAALEERGVRGRQRLRHLVEGLGERTDLLARVVEHDALVEAAGGDRPSRLGEPLYRDRDRLGDRETRPDTAEGDDQRGEQERQDVVVHQRPPQDANLAVLVVGASDLGAAAGNRPR